MIVKGKSRGDAAQLSSYLLSHEKNERVDIVLVIGTGSENLHKALAQMEAAAEGSRCELPLYHAQLRTAPGEHLTAEQWERSAEVLAEQLGMTEHARAVVLHTKDGQQHAHVVFGRMDPETMRAADDGNNYIAHEATARQLEREFGLRRVQGVHVERNYDKLRPERTPEAWEYQQGDRLKIDAKAFRQEMRDLRAQCDNGPAFVAALSEHGVTLSQGDRRDLVLIDALGGVHSLSRTLGMKVAEIKEYLADVARDGLPTVEEARAHLPDRAPALESPAAEVSPPREAPEPTLTPVQERRAALQQQREAERAEIAGHIGTAWREADGDALQFVVNLGEAGLTLATNERGRPVAIDARGREHWLTERSLDDDPRAAQKAIAAAFDGTTLSLPIADEVKAEREAERIAAWKAERAAERRAAYVVKQRDRLESNKTVQAINVAWEAGANATEFVAALEGQGIKIAAVTEQEAQASREARHEGSFHRASRNALGVDPATSEAVRIPRELHAGDFYGINKHGHAYAIDATTIRSADDKEILSRLGELAHEPPSLANARAAQQERRTVERAAWVAERAADCRVAYIATQRARLADNETVNRINDAWEAASTMADFAAVLDQQDVIVARVSKEEAAASLAARALAQESGADRIPRAMQAGDLYAVNRFGSAFILDGTTIREGEEREIYARLAEFAPHEQPSVVHAKAAQVGRKNLERAEWIAERAAERLAENPTVRAINDAWHSTPEHDPINFLHALDDHRIIAAYVSREEAEASLLDHVLAEGRGERPTEPMMREGDLYAVNRFGKIFRIDSSTIQQDEAQAISERLAEIEPHVLTDIAGARTMQEQTRDRERLEARRERMLQNPYVAAVVEQINDAYFSSDSGGAFVQALEDHGLVLVRVNEDEAIQSKHHAEVAKSYGYYAPAYAEGQYLSLDRNGRAYALDAVTIHDGAELIADRLKESDGREQLSWGEGRDLMAWLHPREVEEPRSFASEWMPGPALGAVTGSVARFGDRMFAELGDVLDYFLGGAAGTRQHQHAELHAAPLVREREMTRAERGRDNLHRIAPEIAATDPQVQSLVASHTADADLMARIRRQMEERDRDRER